MELPEQLTNLLSNLPQPDDADNTETLLNKKQSSTKPVLRVEKDKRKGNTATLITGYTEDCDEVRELAKSLKHALAVGGSTRDGEILLQGDVRNKVSDYLIRLGYKVKTV